MKKMYKNLLDTDISLTLFGVGKVFVPANAEMELDVRAVTAIQKMTYVKVFEEIVEPNDDSVERREAELQAIKMAAVEGDVKEEEIAVALEEGTLGLEDLTKKELKTKLDAKGVSYNNRDNKSTLIALLLGEVNTIEHK